MGEEDQIDAILMHFVLCFALKICVDYIQYSICDKYRLVKHAINHDIWYILASINYEIDMDGAEVLLMRLNHIQNLFTAHYRHFNSWMVFSIGNFFIDMFFFFVKLCILYWNIVIWRKSNFCRIPSIFPK